MSYFDFICLWMGYCVMALFALTFYGLYVHPIFQRLAGKTPPNNDHYYMGPPSPCCCEYHPQQVCCFCGEIEGATASEWKHVQPPKELDSHPQDA